VGEDFGDGGDGGVAEEGQAAELGAALEELGVEGGHEVAVGEELVGGAEWARVDGALRRGVRGGGACGVTCGVACGVACGVTRGVARRGKWRGVEGGLVGFEVGAGGTGRGWVGLVWAWRDGIGLG